MRRLCYVICLRIRSARSWGDGCVDSQLASEPPESFTSFSSAVTHALRSYLRRDMNCIA